MLLEGEPQSPLEIGDEMVAPALLVGGGHLSYGDRLARAASRTGRPSLKCDGGGRLKINSQLALLIEKRWPPAPRGGLAPAGGALSQTTDK